MKYLLNILMCVVVMAAGSCDSSEETASNDAGYFPLRTGFYQVYTVEEITYELGDPDTIVYELRTEITDSFTNSRGNTTYVIHRSKKIEGESSFEYLDTWSVEADAKEVIVNEANIPYVKLKFPAAVGNEWDGNTYNTVISPSSNEHVDTYEIVDAGNEIIVNNLAVGPYIKIVQEDNQEFIVYFDKRVEIYAREVGLVSREITQLQYCTSPACLGDQLVESGLIYKQTLKEYGEK